MKKQRKKYSAFSTGKRKNKKKKKKENHYDQRRKIQKVRRIIQMEKQYTELQLGKDIIMIQIVEGKIRIQQL